MTSQRFNTKAKDEFVRPIVNRGYSVAEVPERLGMSAHGLYKRVRTEQQ
jgi:transposase-like protein